MEQFSLDKWLKDKSHKVVTRRGNPVRIICTDRKHGEDDLPIVFLEETNDGEVLVSCKSNGMHDNYAEYPSQHDLFFADEEEKLTEFEKTMIQFSHERNSLIQFEHPTEEINAHLYRYSEKLLDLARKELEANYYTKVLDDRMVFKSELHTTDLQSAYDMGKQDALKDLPKWRKNPSREKETMYGMSEISDIYYKGYFIHLDDIYKALPKEE